MRCHHFFRRQMELPSPSHPPGPTGEQVPGFSPPASSRQGFDRISRMGMSSPFPDIFYDDRAKVHVAVGKTVEKAVDLIHWALRTFRNREICIVHVHRPSSFIPTPLGKLRSSQASSEVVSAHRRVERQQMRELLFHYLTLCSQSKFRASIIATEAAQVQKGIVDLVSKHGIRKLVLGGEPENCMKVRKSYSKASYAAKNAPQFCEMWFVNKGGKHVWMRDAFEGPTILESISQP